MSVQTRLKDHILGMLSLAYSLSNEKERDPLIKALKPFTSQYKFKSVETFARDELQVQPKELDADPWLLNLTNGVLDLRTVTVRNGRVRATLHPHDPIRLLTRLAPVTFDPRAESPLWHGFLTVVLRQNAELDWADPLGTADADQELERYTQELAGLSLTGDVRDDALIFAYGPGGSGKTTFMNTLEALLGGYAVPIAFDLLLTKPFGTGSDHRDLHRLHGARAAFASEVSEGQKWDLATVKQLTGGDKQLGRRLYEEKFEFTPTAKLWCRANDKPAAYDPSNGFWRRLRLLPFEHAIPELRKNTSLRDALLAPAELSGVLLWALEGLARWLERGHLPADADLPPRVRMATETYRTEQVDDDPLAPFFEECCRLRVKTQGGWTPTAVLYAAFEQWWRDRGRSARDFPKSTAFGKALTARGLLPKKDRWEGRSARGWTGIVLR